MRRETGRVFEITFTSQTWPMLTSRPLNHLREANTSGVFNCGYGRGYSVKEVIKAVEAERGVKLPVTIAERRPGDPAAVVADSSKLRNEIAMGRLNMMISP